MNGLFHLAKTDCPLVSAAAAALANAFHRIPVDGQPRFGAAASREVQRALLKGPLELPGRTFVRPNDLAADGVPLDTRDGQHVVATPGGPAAGTGTARHHCSAPLSNQRGGIHGTRLRRYV